MFGNFNRFNREECFHAIDSFLMFAQSNGKDSMQSLTEIILYYLDPTVEGMVASQAHIPVVAKIKEMCQSKNHISRGNLLTALTTVCHKIAPDAHIAEVFDIEYCPAKIMAAFHREAVTNTIIQLAVHLEQFAKLSPLQQAVNLFCIKSFIPEITFYGNFVDALDSESNCDALNRIIECLTYKVPFTFTDKCMGIMSSKERSVFLAGVSKASKLTMDNTRLDQWSAQDWEQFIDVVEQNTKLSSISLNKNFLYQSGKEPEKLHHILKLFHIPHLKELNLYNNYLEHLPVERFQELRQAITTSVIPEIGLRHIPLENTASASSNGLFARSDSFLKAAAEARPVAHQPQEHIHGEVIML